MNLKLTTGVRDQKAAGSNPATSTRVKPLDFQGFFYFDCYAVLTFEGSFLLKNRGFGTRMSQMIKEVNCQKYQSRVVMRATCDILGVCTQNTF